MEYQTVTKIQTENAGRGIAATLQGGEVLCLYGGLGAGKTTFITGLIQYFLPDKRVLSPTFIIVRHYQVKDNRIKNICHVDLYRLEKSAEIRDLGISDFMAKPDTVTVVEWADRASKSLPLKRTDIYFEIVGIQKRKITIIQPWKT